MVLAPDRKSSTLRGTVIKDALYGECSEEDVILAQSLLAPEALAPLTTPVSYERGQLRASAQGLHRVSFAIGQVSLSEQRRMARAQPCQQIHLHGYRPLAILLSAG